MNTYWTRDCWNHLQDSQDEQSTTVLKEEGHLSHRLRLTTSYTNWRFAEHQTTVVASPKHSSSRRSTATCTMDHSMQDHLRLYPRKGQLDACAELPIVLIPRKPAYGAMHDQQNSCLQVKPMQHQHRIPPISHQRSTDRSYDRNHRPF
jgi:hypothetical protein